MFFREQLLQDALKEVLQLIDDGVLIRDTSKDDNMREFLKQGVRITNTLRKAIQALEEEEN